MDTRIPGQSLPETPRPSRSSASQLRAWAEAAAGGDTEAFARLYDACRGWVLARCRARLPVHDAEDVCAEVFARTWRHLAAGKSIEYPLAWLATVTRNLITDHRSRAGRVVPAGDLVGDSESAGARVADRCPGPGEVAAVAEVVPIVVAWLAELSPAARAAVTGQVTAEDQSVTSARAGCSLPALRSCLYRARKRLRARLTARDLPCPRF